MRKCSLLLILFTYISGLSFIYGSDVKHYQDSLIQQLVETSVPDSRMELLQEISFLNLNNPSCAKWLHQLIQEARMTKRPEKEDWAIRNLTRYYYIAKNTDSITYYAQKSDSLAKVMGKYSDYYYDSQTFLSQYLLWNNQLEKAAELTIRLYNLAKENKNNPGIICCCETLGLIHQRIGQDSTAIHFFIEGLDLLRKSTKEGRYIVQLLSDIVESELKLERFEDLNKHLEEFQSEIDNIKNGVYGFDPSFPYNRCAILTEAYYLNLDVRKKNASEARKHIDAATPLLKELDDDYVKVFYMYSTAGYYKLTREYPQALNTINEVIKFDPSLEYMKLKADILYEMGNTQEAAIQYKKALKQNEEMNSAAFLRQLSQLHTLYDMNNLELQVKELRVKELELDVKQHQLKYSFILVLILLVALLFGTKIYIQTCKLKNELQKDKQALLNSQNELRIARDHAEEADRLKSLFLSNMSHEIRTPLNAIVGFAQILEQETDANNGSKEYTRIITDNAALLLNLVNDILDISRLESERYRFTFEKQNLAECCQSALSSIEHRVKPGVKLKFITENKGFVLNTDKFRLQQILTNLLGNASKFTETGFIELAYTIHEKEGFVRFTVTDTGRGIPVDKQDTIFERFEKLNEYIQGTGLGLSICRIIAERFEGTVSIDKEYIHGARFIFTHSLYAGNL